jgi:hypothetical protein
MARPSLYKRCVPWRVRRFCSPEYHVGNWTQWLFSEVYRTPPVRADDDSVTETFTLLDKKNVRNFLVAIKSLFLSSRVAPSVTVLSDGTLGTAEEELLRKHVTGIRVVRQDRLPVPDRLGAVIERVRSYYPHIQKLSFPYLARKKSLLFLDSDVVFRRRLPDDFLSLPAEVGVVYNRDHDHSRYDDHFHYVLDYVAKTGRPSVTDLNSGLMLWDRDVLLGLDAVDFLLLVEERLGSLHYVAEQDYFNILASQTQAVALPEEYLVLSNWERNTQRNRKRAIAIHYVGGERFKRFDYMRDGLRVLRAMRSRPRRAESVGTGP